MKTLGIRPEHLVLTDDNPKARGTVLYAEALGAETLLHLRMSDGEMATVRQDSTAPVPVEKSEVGLTWDDRHQMLFDAASARLR